MAIFNYTLPSGAQYQVSVPTGTTQVQADNIFYSQVAAGTFVDYKIGDTLTHPEQAFSNFGITRLQRGTAGVDDKTLLAIIAGLPIVAPLPALTNQPVQNPIDQSSYIQVTSTPTGIVNLSLQAGQLTPQQTQSLMAQMASLANNTAETFSQADGIGIYGFNCHQLEQAGIVKPGMSQLYCPTDAFTGANPSNFVDFMKSPTPWTGLYGITSINDILNDAGLQNQIQQNLLQQSYDQLVSNGTIVPPAAKVTTPSISTGQIYNANGKMVSASVLGLLALGSNDATQLQIDFLSTLGQAGSSVSSAFSNLLPKELGSIPVNIQKLGTDAVAQYTSGLSSLTSGAAGFTSNILNNASAAVGTSINQLSGLATGLTGGAIASVTSSLTSAVNGDVGALMAVGSKYGTSIASAWAGTTGSLSTLGTSLSSGVSSITAGLNSSVTSITAGLSSSVTSITSGIGASVGALTSGITSSVTSLTSGITNQLNSLSSGINSLAKSAISSINFSDFSLSSLISRVQPAAAFSNTVNRASVDAAINRVIGSPLITPPVYELPSLKSLGTALDISSAQKLLSQAQSAINGIPNLANLSNLTNPIQGAVGQVQSVLNTAQGAQTVVNKFIKGLG